MMLDILTTVAPVFDVLGSVPITTDHLHEAAEHAAELAHADEHLHGESESEGLVAIWNEAWSVISDPAHAIAEVFYNIAVDLVIIPIVVLLYKKIREPKLRAQIHKEIDEEHGVTHEDCSGGSKDQAAANFADANR
jgi:p-aminobenzoyl-glutamate transporter AbgT